MSNFKNVYQKFIHLSIASEALSEFPRLEVPGGFAAGRDALDQ